MSESNGSTQFPPRKVARNLGEFVHDVVTLAELQADLLKVDARKSAKQVISPAILLAAAACIAIGCVPVALTALAYGLIELGLAHWLGFLIATICGLAIAGGVGLFGWRRFKSIGSAFKPSKEEFTRNVHWVKGVLKNSETSGAERPPSFTL